MKTATGEMQPLILPRSGRRFNPALLYQVNNFVGASQRTANAYKAYKESIFADSEKDEKKEPPKPSYKECSPIPMKPIKMSSELHVYRVLTAEEQDAAVEYEMDDVDELWLKAMQAERKIRIDRETFVQIIDRLEKESTFQPKKSPNSMVNTDDACCICGMEDDDDLNRIIYCDLCNIAVHQECYGVPFIPEGSWYCRRCKLSPSAPVSCVMCPNQDGAFKTTSDQRWVHVICTIWLNELHFLNTVFLEPVEGVDRCLEIRSRLRCMICKKKTGACIQCSQRSCIRAFHVTCAQAAGIYMKVEADEDSDASEMMDVQRFAYCHMHHPNDKETDVAVKKRKMEEACKVAHKALKKKKNYNLPVSVPKISTEKIENIARRFHCTQYIKEVVEFWLLKRKQRFGVPLIPRLQEEVELRSAEQETNILENPAIDELRTEHGVIRNDLERQRMLWELVKKREILKKEHVTATKNIFELLYTPLELLFVQILQELEQQDRRKVFIEPAEKIISSYRSVIPKPMDIQTMKSKLMTKKYSSIADIRKDLDLICANCEKYNTTFPNDFYIQYGRKYHKKCLKILERYQDRSHFSNSILKNDSEKIGETLAKMNFYETDLCIERVKENAPIDNIPPLTNGNIFLQPPSKSMPHFGLLGNKRPLDGLPLPSIKRRKIQTNEDSGLRQTSMKQFMNPPCTSPTQVPAAIEGRRSRQNLKQPFTDYRQNSIQSPLAADIASSTEYSTEDDDKIIENLGRETIRREGRLRRTRTAPIQQSRTNDSELSHNDIVYITQPGAHQPVIGRVLDPRYAELDDSLTPDVVNKVRKQNGNGDSLFVLHFGDPTCASYPISNLRLVDFDVYPSPRSKQFKLAAEFRNKTTGK